jgi:hypothetical protein
MKASKQELVESIVKSTGNRFFSVEFVKKDGTIRHMTARLGVTKHLKGGERSYNPEEKGNIIVFDVVKKAYRTINTATVRSIRTRKQQITFD